uniref:Uncharacterized protein n=1 Tax=Arundo donax TaxID=35708 RepID=A0A0A8ZCI8_ARUDO
MRLVQRCSEKMRAQDSRRMAHLVERTVVHVVEVGCGDFEGWGTRPPVRAVSGRRGQDGSDADAPLPHDLAPIPPCNHTNSPVTLPDDVRLRGGPFHLQGLVVGSPRR